MDWVFNGIGTQVIVILVSLLIGGGAITCFKKQKIKQKQKAGAEAQQNQTAKMVNNEQENKPSNKQMIKQTQKAGAKASQLQIGEIKNAKQSK